MTFRYDQIIHFIGIGGIGMSAIAKILVSKGYKVTGSDLRKNRTVIRLQAQGVKIFLGHEASNVQQADVVVYSSAVRDTNPEIIRAKELQLKIIKRAEMLAEILTWRQSIVCAGSHGKTTTTSMVTTILEQTGKSPTSIIGGELEDIGGNAKLGSGEWCIAEGDESDGSLVNLHPDVAVITNIDLEHLDHYPDIESIIECFRQFMQGTKPGGRFVICSDNLHLAQLAKEFPRESISSYGFNDGADYQLRNIKSRPGGTEFHLFHAGENLGTIEVNVPGRHNALNGVAACLATMQTGLTLEEATSGLRKYRGVGRRFERKGQRAGVTVLDDYGHHPSEIEATLEALFTFATGRKIVVFQPHRYSRTAHLMKDFSRAFNSQKLDMLVLTDIYSAGETPIEGVTGEALAACVGESAPFKVLFVSKIEDIPDAIATELGPGDTVLTLGAGDVFNVGERLLDILGGKHGA